MLETLKGYLDPNLPAISNLANMAAILHYYLPEINWAGFYLFQQEKLILGPFQGLPACTEIRLGKGVCGTAASKQETIVVPDVALFPGHIACDSLSRSEIVVPIMVKGTLYGVLDIDSPILKRFEKKEQVVLEKAVALLVDIL
jgi:GAF domain-containing protein